MYAVLVVSLATFCGSRAVQAADCSKSIAVESVDLKSLEGDWYEHSSYGTPFGHRLERCHATTIKAGSDGKSFVMANDHVVRMINTHIKTNWIVEEKGDKLTGDLTLKFKLPLVGTVAVPFKILGTDDYKNYIIFQACYSFASVFKSNLGFIFTRRRQYEAKELESLYSSIDEILKKNSLRRSQFTLSNQSNCEDKSISLDKTDSTTSTAKTSANAFEAEKNSDTKEPLSAKTEETAASKTEDTSASKTEETPASKAENTSASKTEETVASKAEDTSDSKVVDKDA